MVFGADVGSLWISLSKHEPLHSALPDRSRLSILYPALNRNRTDWVLGIKRITLGVYDGFLFVSFATLLVCVGIYWFLIRPFRITRVLFGVK